MTKSPRLNQVTEDHSQNTVSLSLDSSSMVALSLSTWKRRGNKSWRCYEGIQLLHQTFIFLTFTNPILSVHCTVQSGPADQSSLYLPNAALQFHVSRKTCLWLPNAAQSFQPQSALAKSSIVDIWHNAAEFFQLGQWHSVQVSIKRSYGCRFSPNSKSFAGPFYAFLKNRIFLWFSRRKNYIRQSVMRASRPTDLSHSHTAKKIRFMHSPKRNCAALSLISTFICLWAILHIATISPAIFLQQNRQTDRGIYEPLTKNINVGNAKPRSFISGNICFEFRYSFFAVHSKIKTYTIQYFTIKELLSDIYLTVCYEKHLDLSC